MHRLNLLLIACSLTLVPTVVAQDSYNSRPVVRSDYEQVSIVARLNIVRVEPNQTQTGYSTYRVITSVVESYKGKLKPGQEFIFNLRVENGYPIEKYRGQKIVFLKPGKSEMNEVEYWSLENSDREPTTRIISILRELRRKVTAKKP